MRVRGTRVLAAALAAAACISASAPRVVRADSIDLNRYTAAETVHDGFTLSRPNDLGSGRVGLVLHLDYANDPLVLELRQGTSNSETAAVVSDQLAAHINFALGLWSRLVLFAGADMNLVMQGEDYVDPVTGAVVRSADGVGLGDGRLGARVRLVGERDDVAGLALQLTLGLPLAVAVASGENYSGEESVTLLPELLFELRPGDVRITMNLGSRIRKDAVLGGTDALSDELVYGLGVTIPLSKDSVDLLLEGFGAASLADFGGRESTPIEWLGGFKFRVADDMALGIVGGTGLVRGIGSPDFRIVGTFGWASAEKPAAPLPEEKPVVPEPRDQDGDGLVDASDQCPTDPEDTDEFEDADGCPDPDNDKDGVLDAADECRNEAEDMDEFADADGCPEPDNDLDGVLDADDRCPIVPGPKSEHGCPGRVRVEKGMIIILERVEFAVNKDVILESSLPLLGEVSDSIAANPQLKLIRVEGHTDDRGKDAHNMDLSSRRARSVARWLRDHGVDEARLEAYGCGKTNPIESNDDESGRQANRRVEFHIIDPAPDTGPRSAVYCKPIAL